MISTSNLGRTFVMATAFALSAFAVAQDPTITISDGSNQCEASLVDLQVDTATGDVIANVVSLDDCAGSVTAAITNFTVDGNSSSTAVDEGDSVSVSWTSVNTGSCASGGTLPAWTALGTSLPSSNTVSLTTAGLPNGNYTMTLACSSQQGLVSAPNNPLTVTVQNSSSTGTCATRPPVSLTRASSIVNNANDNASLFESVFGPFPGSGNSQQVSMDDTKYAAMEFTTDGTIASSAFGSLELATLQPLPNNTATGGFAPRLWSISRCPGDFRKHVIDTENGPGCVQGGTGNFAVDQGPFKWGGSNYISDSGVCALEPNTTYYLNLLYTDQSPPTSEQAHSALTNKCVEQFCGHGMQPRGTGF